MIIFFIAAVLLSICIIYFLYMEKDKRDLERERYYVDKSLETFSKTMENIFGQLNSTTQNFMDNIGYIQIEHFNQLKEQTNELAVVFGDNVERFVDILKKEKVEKEFEKIEHIESPVKNDIEKEEEVLNPLEDFNPADFRNIKGVSFEGQEEILPISME